MKKNRILSIILAGVLLAGVLAACAPVAAPPPAVQPPAATGQAQAHTPPAGAPEPAVPAEEVPARGIIVATNAEPPSIAPARHVSDHGARTNQLTHNGLFRTDAETLQPVPDLVASWRALSDTLFEFTLHEGVLFHNGEELTAYDVVVSVDYVRNYPEARAVHGSIVNAEVIDRHTFTLDTGTPNALLFVDLTHQGNFVMPASLIEAGHDFQANPIGSGPYVFDDWRRGDSLTFTRFDSYFDTTRAPILEYVHWRIIPEGASRTIALETGEVDFIVEVANPDIPRMQENPDITVYMRPGTGYNFMLLNNDLPKFSNVYVRRAIDMAIDKEAAVMASLDGFGIPTWQNMPKVFAGASAEGIRSFDPDGARALLAEQGVDPGAMGFEMLAFNEEGRRRAEVVQSNLADIGIPTTITQLDLATYLSLTQFGDFEAGFSGFGSTSLLAFFAATSHINTIDAQNRSRMRNQELSDLIDKAIATIDADTRYSILEEASRVANEHVGFIPMHQNILVRAFNSNLVAPELSGAGAINLNVAYWAE